MFEFDCCNVTSLHEVDIFASSYWCDTIYTMLVAYETEFAFVFFRIL